MSHCSVAKTFRFVHTHQITMHTTHTILMRILAALTLFTRLPLWRLCAIDASCYRHVVPLWPLAGWVTGGLMSLVCYVSLSLHLPVAVAVLLALIGRVLLTGALHEDGFADFCDGFGGGTSRESILAIMKDSHIGTYGVLGLVLYYLLLWTLLTSLLPSSPLGSWLFFVVDPMCKMVSSSVIYFLPYARKSSEAKILTAYERPSLVEAIASIILGIAPLSFLHLLATVPSLHMPVLSLHVPFFSLCLPFLAAIVTVLSLVAYMRHRLQGYTGDCCGATFIITETIFYLLCILVF